MKNEIIPAILANSKRVLESRIKKVKVKTIQIDIMDGKFVKNKSIKIEDLPKSKINYDLHLMAKEPFEYLEIAKKKGIKRFIFHIETCKKAECWKLIRAIKNRKMKVGIAINPETKIEKIKPYVKDIDLVLVMTVKPGASGQKFKKTMLEKVKTIRRWGNLNIGVDGGVNEKNYMDCIAAGANVLVMGSAIYTKKEPTKFIEKMKKMI